MSVVSYTITSDGKAVPPEFEVLSIDVIKELNRIPTAQIVLIENGFGDKAFAISNGNDFKPGREIEIKLGYENSSTAKTTIFKGFVVAQRIESGAAGAQLTVELKDAAFGLTLTRRSAVYVDQSDNQVIGNILGAARLKQGRIPTTKPVHKQLVQYACSDWDFLLARADANGLLVRVEDGEVILAYMDIAGAPALSLDYNAGLIYEAEIAIDGGSQYASVEGVAWDIAQQQATNAVRAKSVKPPQGNLKGDELPRALGVAAPILSSFVPLEQQEIQAWADGTLARSRMALLRGRISTQGVATIKLLDVLAITGIGSRFDGKNLVSGIRHRLDRDDWRTDIQFGLSPERFAERRDLIDLPAAGLLPGINSLQIGVVSSLKEDPEKQFRVQVQLPSREAQGHVIWARVASPDAGVKRGFFFWPEVGDEVVIGFLNDDPRQAIILGALYSSKNRPFSGFAAFDEKNQIKGIATKKGTRISFTDTDKPSVLIETPGQNAILIDDDAQAITLSDQHGNKITMDKNGVVISSAKDLTLEASGAVTIKGQKVDVK